jgi:hypothetical protein
MTGEGQRKGRGRAGRGLEEGKKGSQCQPRMRTATTVPGAQPQIAHTNTSRCPLNMYIIAAGYTLHSQQLITGQTCLGLSLVPKP